MDACIRPITEADQAAWLRLRQQLYHDVGIDFHHHDMRSILAAADREAYFICHESGDIMGMLELCLRNYVDGCLSSPVAYIEGIYLKPAYRGQKHATQLLRYAEAWGRRHGCTELATDSALADEQAQAFHRHQGFVEVDRIVEFKKSL